MGFKKVSTMIVLTILFAVLSACGTSNGQSSDSSEEDKGTVEMGQINWAENIAVTNMWKVILEDRGYNVEFSVIDMGTTMAALKDGGLDVSLEVWLPVQDANYLEQYQEDVNFSDEVWYENAKVGLVVPTYMEEVNSIEDLNDHKEKFEGEITGFDPGAGTMEVTEQLIEEYDLEFELIPSSEPAMLTEIKQAISNEEGIVAPLWSPHRIFAEEDLKYLEDPKNVYGDTEKIHHATRLGFEEDFPEFSQWLKNWKMTDEQIGELMIAVNETEEPIDGAREWVEENEDLINEWVE